MTCIDASTTPLSRMNPDDDSMTLIMSLRDFIITR